MNGKPVIMPGLDVETALNDKLWRDRSIIGIPISDVRTTVCQNRCSGHGVCNSDTRACMCQTFWMPSIYYFWGISEANCGEFEQLPIVISKEYHDVFSLVLTDWSIIYVVSGVFVCFLVVTLICWLLTLFCRRRPRTTRSRSKPQKYSLLETQEHDPTSREYFIIMEYLNYGRY